MANKQINKFIKKLSSFAIFDNDDVRPIIKEEILTIKEEIRQEIKRIKYDSYADGYGVGLEDGANMERQDILQIVIEDVPHIYQKRLLKILKRKSSSIY